MLNIQFGYLLQLKELHRILKKGIFVMAGNLCQTCVRK